MLEHLSLENVGPAPQMTLELAKRVNLITGDNGLGKSFLLDVAWWALTRRWPREVNHRMTSGHPARPRDTERLIVDSVSRSWPERASRLGGRVLATGAVLDREARPPRASRDSRVRPRRRLVFGVGSGEKPLERARRPRGKGASAGICVYRSGGMGRAPGYRGRRLTPVCNGLLYDWSRWIQAEDENAMRMAHALRTLSPPTSLGRTSDRHAITPGLPVRLSVEDSRDVPSIKTDYAGQVPNRSRIFRHTANRSARLRAGLDVERAPDCIGNPRRRACPPTDHACRRSREPSAPAMAAIDSGFIARSRIGFLE